MEKRRVESWPGVTRMVRIFWGWWGRVLVAEDGDDDDDASSDRREVCMAMRPALAAQ